MGERLRAGIDVLVRPKPQLLTLESLQGRLAKDKKDKPQTSAAYLQSLTKAQLVLQEQPGIAWLWGNVPIYAVQDVHGDSEALVKLLGKKIQLEEGEKTLFEALGKDEAKVVLLGDVAHSQAPTQWRKKGDHFIGVGETELAVTMNAEQMAFDLVSAFPGRFIWLRGNHDSQKNTRFSTNEKNLAIAAAMKKKYRDKFYEFWTETEDYLPLMAASPFVILSHGAPDADISIFDVAKRKSKAYQRLAGTENRQDFRGHISEKQIGENMEAIYRQFPYQLIPQWTWGAGHRPTDKEPHGFRLQCDDHLIQINKNKKEGQLYAVFHPDGRVYVGECKSNNAPELVERNVA
jgi:metallophosphoesterase superfamily enzyme